mgnify:CR=1 FL=1
MIRITRNPIRPEAAIEAVRKKANGAVIAYVGTVRDVSHDRRVIFMEHQASLQDLARQELERIAEDIRLRWRLQDISIIHRIGKLRTGEILLVVALGDGGAVGWPSGLAPALVAALAGQVAVRPGQPEARAVVIEVEIGRAACGEGA